MNGEYMKLLFLGILILTSLSSFANSPVVRCDVRYINKTGSGINLTTFHDVGKMSVQNCINRALVEFNNSSTAVDLKFYHFTKTTNPNVDIGSEGWAVSAKIVDQDKKPSKLQYEEFVNP
jgi:hypothetical protein